MTAPSNQNTLRVLVVGDTGVGKTLLLERLRRVTGPSENVLAPSPGPTIGFNVEVILGNRQQLSLGNKMHASSIAFIELGGNRNFGRSSQFPIGLMSFDGVIFVYNNHNANSAIGLSYWYEDLKNYGAVGGIGRAKVMLLETMLAPPLLNPLGPAVRPPDELLGAYLQRTIKVVPPWKRFVQKVQYFFFRLVGPLRPSVRDFQHYQGNLRVKIAVLLFYWASKLENMLLFLFAVILFGPYQRSVPLRRPSVAQALLLISSDVSGTQKLLSCPLYDQLEFEASAMEKLRSFLESLRCH